jgi:electron transfer flavoprotein beta subunit
MRILVPVKRVVDYNVKVRVKSDGSGVELANVKMSMNPFDEIAVEEALRLKEAGKATEVVVSGATTLMISETCRTSRSAATRGITFLKRGGRRRDESVIAGGQRDDQRGQRLGEVVRSSPN